MVSARSLAILQLLLVGAIWGLAGPIIKHTLAFFPADIFLTYRFLVSVVIGLPLVYYLHPRLSHDLGRLTPGDWFLLTTCGLIASTVQLGLLFWGFEHTTAIEGTLISATAPILVAIAGHFLLRETVNRREQVGLLIGLLGTLVIVIGPHINSTVHLSNNLLGNTLIMLSNLAWVGYAILAKKTVKLKLPAAFISVWIFIAGFISMLFISSLLHTPPVIIDLLTQAPLQAHLWVWFMAGGSGILAYYLFQSAQSRMDASEASLVHYLPPIFATPLGYFWLNEPLTGAFMTGSLIILVGVALAEIRVRRRRR